MTTNPLIENSGIANFPAIKSEHIAPAVDFLESKCLEMLKRIETNTETPSWENTVVALEEINLAIHDIWGPIAHLLSVRMEEDFRKEYEKAEPRIVSLGLKLGQSKEVYARFNALKDSASWKDYSSAQKRTVEGNILSQELSGIGLEGDKQTRFNEIQSELSNLSTSFSNNVLDALKEWKKVLTSKEEVDGLSANTLAQLSQTYKAMENKETTPEQGPWMLTLSMPIYIAFMDNATNRGLREELYKAFSTKASSGELDNTGNIKKILKLRKEKADLLGFKNYAELSLAQKMANKVDEIYDLFSSMRDKAMGHAKAEFSEISELAKASGESSELENWDLNFWAKRLEEKKYAYTDDELKPYFALPNVLNGLFKLVNKIFGITVEEANGEAPVWDKDVSFFKINSSSGNHIASFYLDPYARPENKRGGAWMNVCVGRRVDSSNNVTIPVAYLVCNGTPPVGDAPSLMTFREVETLFHEFGHGLQHMLTNIGVPSVAGINGVEWDAVELPSQFMENWCYHKETLLGLAKHYQTGETLPEELFNKIVAAKNYRSGHQILRQSGFAYIDLKLHTDFDPETGDIFKAFNDVNEQFNYMKSHEDAAKFLCSFSHIFAGGYSAGYYSYMWANVLAADAFAAFEEVGLDNTDKIVEVGGRFRDTVLGLGGSEHPSEVFAKFRGREPKTDAFMRQSGLV